MHNENDTNWKVICQMIQYIRQVTDKKDIQHVIRCLLPFLIDSNTNML